MNLGSRIIITVACVVCAAVIVWIMASWGWPGEQFAPEQFAPDVPPPPWVPKLARDQFAARWCLILFFTFFPAWWLKGRLYRQVGAKTPWDTLLEFGILAVLWVVWIFSFIFVTYFLAPILFPSDPFTWVLFLAVCVAIIIAVVYGYVWEDDRG
jgi:hypothetical protein